MKRPARFLILWCVGYTAVQIFRSAMAIKVYTEKP